MKDTIAGYLVTVVEDEARSVVSIAVCLYNPEDCQRFSCGCDEYKRHVYGDVIPSGSK